MSYKVKGTIASIGQKKALDNGAIVLDYVVNVTSDNGFVTLNDDDYFSVEKEI